MYLQTYLIIANTTYYVSCKFFEPLENQSLQRIIAFQNSMKNFMHTALLCIILNIFGINKIPTTTENSTLYDTVLLFWWAFITEIIFTIVHRMLHTDKLYWIHKQHHKNNPSFSTSSMDSHPIEFIFGNVLSIAVPIYLYPGSKTISTLYIIGVVANSCYSHSVEGKHTIHHKRFRFNYGQGSFLFDRVFGTYSEYKKD